MKNLLKIWPIIFLFFSPLVYAFPFFLQGRIPFPSAYVGNDLGPWNRNFTGMPVKNGIPDVPGEIFPLRSLVIDFWQQGTLPLWNPHIFSGSPLLANFQSAVFSPFNLVFFLLPKIDAWSILVILQPLLAGLFTYLYLRILGLKKVSALIAAVSFMFSGFLTVWNTYLTLGYTVLFLPLVLFLVEKYLKEKKRLLLPFLTLVLGCSFFSGHIQTWSYVFLATVIYVFSKFFTDWEKKKGLLALLFFIFLTIPFVSLQLFPTLEFYGFTGRSLIKNNSAVGIPLNYLITLLSPDFFGNPVTRNDWFGTYAEWSSYIGVIAFIFSLVGLVNLRGEKKFWPIATLGFLGIILAVSNPFLSLLVKLPIPIISNSNPTRAIVLLSFALSVLAGFGFDFFLKEKKPLKKILPIGLTVSLILVAAFMYVILSPYLGISFNDKLKSVSLRNLLYSLLMIGVFWGIIALYWKKPQWQRIIAILFLVLVLFESVRFYKKWTPFDERKFAYPPTELGKFLTGLKTINRFHGQLGQAPAYLYHLFSAEGYEPLNIYRYANLLSSSITGNPQMTSALEVKLQSRDQYSKRLMDLLGIKYLIFPAHELDNPFNFPILAYPRELYPKVFDDGKYAVFENGESLPRAKLFYAYEIADKNTTSHLLNDKFDYRNVLLLEKNPGFPSGPISNEQNVTIDKYLPNEIMIRATSKTDAMLFLSDNYYPGWEVTVNGTKSEIYRANYTFRGVKISSGENKVHFYYNPFSFRLGLLVTALTAGFLISLIVILILLRFTAPLSGAKKRIR